MNSEAKMNDDTWQIRLYIAPGAETPEGEELASKQQQQLGGYRGGLRLRGCLLPQSSVREAVRHKPRTISGANPPWERGLLLRKSV